MGSCQITSVKVGRGIVILLRLDPDQIVIYMKRYLTFVKIHPFQTESPRKSPCKYKHLFFLYKKPVTKS